jgi:hypothetical protein
MENKNIFKIVLLLSATSFLISCGNLENPKERNTLAFTDSIASVADSINVLNSILLNTHKENYIYAIDSNYLYIDNREQTAVKIGALSDSLLFESKSLSFISTSNRKHFISLVAYLNRNYLSRCDIENGQPIYMYRDDIYMADRQTDLFRFVVFANSEQGIDLNRYKILDEHKNLYLLANKEAKIWSDN